MEYGGRMNDRLKYRVFDKVANKYIDLKDFRKGEIEFNFDPDTQTIWIEYDKSRYVVEQCTGLRDKNGTLIFEGDILKQPQLPHIVVCEWYKDGFWLNGFINGAKRELRTMHDWYIVIGNIYENADLLRGSKC